MGRGVVDGHDCAAHHACVESNDEGHSGTRARDAAGGACTVTCSELIAYD